MAKKCPICGLKSEESEMTQIGTRWYHLGKCVQEKQLELKEAQDYKDLVMYLCNLCEVEQPMPSHLAYIKKLREDYKMKSRGIMLTVQYYYEKLNNPIKDKTNLLGIVIYKYEEARLDFIENLSILQNAKDFVMSGKKPIVHGDKIVLNSKSLRDNTSVSPNKAKRVDISKIVEGDNDK